jgi:hypothetical protein
MATVIRASSEPFIGNASQPEQDGTLSQIDGLLSDFLSGWSNWQIAVTILLVLITYDQCKLLGYS